MAIPFKNGTDPRRNTKGRPPGTKNKSTTELRNFIHNFINDNRDKIQTDFDTLEAKDRLSFIEKMLKHVLPAPLNELEKLTDDQLDEVIDRLKNPQYKN